MTAHSNIDSTFLALAHPIRRSILNRLSAGEARVTDIAAPFDLALNSVSKHIRVLERARLVRRRRSGRDHFLSLDSLSFDEAADWVITQRRLWKMRLQTLDELLQEEDRNSNRGDA